MTNEEIQKGAENYANQEDSAWTNDYNGFVAGANFAIEKQALDAVQALFQKDPIKLLQYMLLCAGRDMKKANAAEMKFSCEMSIEDERFDIQATILLNPQSTEL